MVGMWARGRLRLGWRGTGVDLGDIAVRHGAPLIVSATSALIFVALQVPVGDLWAARARQSAAAHGAGLEYWFAWFGGGSPPASYSVISPYLSALVGSAVLAGVATVVTVGLVAVVAKEAAHPMAAVWVAVIVTGFDLWCGRVAFIVGTAFAAALAVAIRGNRVLVCGVLALCAALSSPVVGVFLLVAVSGVVLTVPGRRLAAGLSIGVTGAALGAMAVLYGSPGVEPIDLTQVRILLAALALMAIARPPRYVLVPLLLSAIVFLALLMFPNPMGGNFNRLVWIWLPIAVVATARRPVAIATSCVAVGMFAGMSNSVNDLRTAFSPAASTAQYAPLLQAMDRFASNQAYRVEAVTDDTHDAAYFLLDHAMLARGYETQLDMRLNPTLWSSSLNASTYRTWLDENAVGFVVLHRSAPAVSYEYQLVAQGLPYLHQVWADTNWTLYRVDHAVPIVARPARTIHADQGSLTLKTPRPGRLQIRVRWSPQLEVSGPAKLSRAPGGWTRLDARRSGAYVLSG